MICFVKFIIPGIQKVFFPLWFTVVAGSHHQIPVYIFFYHILGRIKGVLALSNVLNDRSAYSGLFFYFPKSRFFVFFASFYCSLRQDPALIFVLVILIQTRIFPRNITTPPQLVASIIAIPPGFGVNLNNWF